MRALTGAVLSGICLMSLLALWPQREVSCLNCESWWAWAIVLFWGSALGFVCSLLLVVAALLSEALCFVLNDRRPARDLLR